MVSPSAAGLGVFFVFIVCHDHPPPVCIYFIILNYSAFVKYDFIDDGSVPYKGTINHIKLYMKGKYL